MLIKAIKGSVGEVACQEAVIIDRLGHSSWTLEPNSKNNGARKCASGNVLVFGRCATCVGCARSLELYTRCAKGVQVPE